MQKSILKYNGGIIMNKLKSSYRIFFKVAVTMSVFSLPSIGASSEVSSQLLDEVHKSINEIANDNLFYSSKASQKSKQEFDALIDTSWELSYSLGGISYNSKMELADYNNTNMEWVEGRFYRDKNETRSDEVACLRVPAKITNGLNIDYTCTVIGSNIIVIGFRILGGGIRNGVVSSGGTAEEAGTNLVRNNFPLTGHLINDPIKEEPAPGEAVFNEERNELVIPIVNYKGGKFRVILQDSGNFVFTIKDATRAN